jgi:hypothetical protein
MSIAEGGNLLTGYEKPEQTKIRLPKILAAMSMPRLAMADNLYTAITVLGSLNIPLQKFHGAFWAQCLELGMLRLMVEEPEFILTLDYDTWFRAEHVLCLYAILRDNPDIDAVFPMQVKREGDAVMAHLPGTKAEDGKSIDYPVEKLMAGKFVPADTGHFGLTLIRTSAIPKMKRPLFYETSGKDGSWENNSGKVDADINFWNNFKASGCKSVLATHIRIGHIQLVSVWPGMLATKYKPFTTYLSELEKGELPPECVPDLKEYGF